MSSLVVKATPLATARVETTLIISGTTATRAGARAKLFTVLEITRKQLKNIAKIFRFNFIKYISFLKNFYIKL
ncbi:hypothetical protein LVU67_19460 [Clostridioides difficile]|nr:hypothetical protein [Clostridioides difficile]